MRTEREGRGGGGGGGGGRIRRPPVCWPFLRLAASPGSVTDTKTVTGEYAYANDFEVRLRDFTDHAKD